MQRSTAVLECPKSMVGRVIGKNGETIKALQSYSGALIQIDQTVEPTKITICGAPYSLSLAVSMVSDIVKGTFKGFALLRQANAANTVRQAPVFPVLSTFSLAEGQPRPVYAPGFGLVPPPQLLNADDPATLGLAAYGAGQLGGGVPDAQHFGWPGAQATPSQMVMVMPGGDASGGRMPQMSAPPGSWPDVPLMFGDPVSQQHMLASAVDGGYSQQYGQQYNHPYLQHPQYGQQHVAASWGGEANRQQQQMMMAAAVSLHPQQQQQYGRGDGGPAPSQQHKQRLQMLAAAAAVQQPPLQRGDDAMRLAFGRMNMMNAGGVGGGGRGAGGGPSSSKAAADDWLPGTSHQLTTRANAVKDLLG